MVSDVKAYDPSKYDPGCFDDNFCLKLPFLLAVSLVYLSRHIILPLATFGTALKTRSNDMMYLVDGIYELAYAMCSLPALILIIAWIKRIPAAGNSIRWIWARGRWFIATSAVFDLSVRLATTANLLKGFTVAACLLDFYILVYLFVSGQARDVFSDFPATQPPSAGRK